MPPAKLKPLAKKTQVQDELSISSLQQIPDIKTNLLKYFTNDELNFMISQKIVSKNPKIPDKIVSLEYIDEYFINIYPLKLYSNNFFQDFLTAINKGLFETSLFDDMKQKEQDEIIFLTSKPTVAEGIKCPKCKQFTTFLLDKQTRSGDEGSDVFLQCTSCNYYSKYY